MKDRILWWTMVFDHLGSLTRVCYVRLPHHTKLMLFSVCKCDTQRGQPQRYYVKCLLPGMDHWGGGAYDTMDEAKDYCLAAAQQIVASFQDVTLRMAKQTVDTDLESV